MKPVIIAAVAVAVTVGVLAVAAGRPARPPRTSRDGLMPEVVVPARGPRAVMDEVVVRAERNRHLAGTAARDSGLN